jgi:ribosomal protein S18 acetylase RimI-like enzyme
LVFRIADFDPALHDRAEFGSGVISIDNFLKLTAKKQQHADMVRVRVMTEETSNRVLGFYVLNAHSIDAGDLPDEIGRKAPRHRHVPAAYISMIGVDLAKQGEGLGFILLANALRQILKASELVATAVVVLDILDDGDVIAIGKRKKYYRRFGFLEFPGQKSRMFLPMALARKIADRLEQL